MLIRIPTMDISIFYWLKRNYGVVTYRVARRIKMAYALHKWLANGSWFSIRDMATTIILSSFKSFGGKSPPFREGIRFYVDNYDVICVEDLNIRNMVQNGNLAQTFERLYICM